MYCNSLSLLSWKIGKIYSFNNIILEHRLKLDADLDGTFSTVVTPNSTKIFLKKSKKTCVSRYFRRVTEITNDPTCYERNLRSPETHLTLLLTIMESIEGSIKSIGRLFQAPKQKLLWWTNNPWADLLSGPELRSVLRSFSGGVTCRLSRTIADTHTLCPSNFTVRSLKSSKTRWNCWGVLFTTKNFHTRVAKLKVTVEFDWS